MMLLASNLNGIYEKRYISPRPSSGAVQAYSGHPALSRASHAPLCRNEEVVRKKGATQDFELRRREWDFPVRSRAHHAYGITKKNKREGGGQNVRQ